MIYWRISDNKTLIYHSPLRTDSKHTLAFFIAYFSFCPWIVKHTRRTKGLGGRAPEPFRRFPKFLKKPSISFHDISSRCSGISRSYWRFFNTIRHHLNEIKLPVSYLYFHAEDYDFEQFAPKEDEGSWMFMCWWLLWLSFVLCCCIIPY